jgi:hypothetical protein
METTFGECTDNEKKETVISDCNEMRTEGTSRPSAGLVGTTRDNHLPVSIPGVMILKNSEADLARNGDIAPKSMGFSPVLLIGKCNSGTVDRSNMRHLHPVC